MFHQKARIVIAIFSSAAALCHASPRYWDGATSAGDPGGGTGTWNTTTTNWDTAEIGGSGVAWTTNDAFFGGTAGIVTLGSTISATSLNFTTSGYTLGVNTRTFSVSGGIFSSLAGEIFSLSGTTGTATFSGTGNLTAAQSVRLLSGKLELQYTASNNPLGEAEIVLQGGTLNLRRDGGNNTTLEELLLKNRVRIAGNVTVNADRFSAAGGTGKLLQLDGLTIGTNTLTTSASTNGFIVGFASLSLAGNATLTTSGETWLGAVTETGGAQTLTKSGADSLVFRETSTWTGGLLIGNGNATALAAGAFGGGAITLGAGTASSSITIGTTSEVQNDITLSGTSGTRTVNIRNARASFIGDVTAGALAVTFDVANGSSATLNGALTGSKSLTKTGPGILSLLGDQSEFGTGAASSIVVSGGLLEVSTDEQLGRPGNGIRLNGGGLLASGTFTSDRTLDVVSGANVVDTTESVELEFTSAGIAGSGPLLKRGAGTLRLGKIASANISFTLNGGELATFVPSGAPFGGALKLNSGLLTLAPASETLATATLTSQTVTFGGSTKISIDNANLTSGGAGTTLATFSSAGISRIDHGTVRLRSEAGIDYLGIAAEGVRWKVTGLANADFYQPYIIAVDSDQTETPHFVGYSTLYGFRSAASIYSDGFNPASNTEIADAGNETLAANETVRAARIGGRLDIEPAVTLTISSPGSTAGIIFHTAGGIFGGSLALGTREAVIYVSEENAAVIESEIVTSGPGGFTKFGAGSLELLPAVANGDLGEISIHEGSLSVNSVAALGTGSAALHIGTAEFSYGGNTDSSLGRQVIIGAAGGAKISSSAATLTLDQTISGGEVGTKSIGLTLTGGGAIVLSNPTNSFTGDVVIDGVDVSIPGQGSTDPTVFGAGQKDVRITSSGLLSIASGTLDPSADTKRFIIDGQAVINVAGGTFRVNDPNQLAGTGTLKITGTGTTELGPEQSDFKANLELEGGTLVLSGSISGSVSVRNSSLLTGSGQTGNIDVFAGATFSPAGTQPGAFQTQGLNIEAGGALRIDIDNALPTTGYDQVSVAGLVTLTTANLQLDLGFAPAPNIDVFYVLLNDDIDPVVGAFGQLNGVPTSLNQGDSFLLGGHTFQISYTAESGGGFSGAGNDIAIRAIPEPSSFGLLLGGLGITLARRRKRATTAR